jgi:hypothetical protein
MTENQTPNRITEITRTQLEAIESFGRSLLPRAGGFSREETQLAIYRMYDHLGLNTPVIFWCRSPFQAAVMPFLLNILMTRNNHRSKRMRTFRQLPEDIREEVRTSLYRRLFNPAWSGALADLLSQFDPVIEDELCVDDEWTMLDHESTIRQEMRRSFSALATAIHTKIDREFSHTAALEIKKARVQSEVLRNRVLANVQAQLSLADGIVVNENLLGLMDRRSLPVSPERMATELALQLGTDFGLKIIHQMFGEDLNSIFWLPDKSPSYVERRLSDALEQSQVSVKWSAWANDELPQFQLPLACISPDFYPEDIKTHLAIWWNFRNAAPAYNAFKRVVFVSEFPTVLSYSDNGALHNLTGPALAFSDGYSIFSVNGTNIEAAAIEDPDFLTVLRIDTERNLERRRVYIELYGLSRYVMDSQATVISEDECGVLYRKVIPRDEPIVVVCVTNSTPEPDGSYKQYFLRVPPDIVTARAAVAWTFGLAKDEYEPAVQT